MAIRMKTSGQKRFLVYWRNPFTGKKEAAAYATEEEAKAADSLIHHRLKYDKESFRPAVTATKENEEVEDDTLEAIDGFYLSEKRFGLKAMRWHMDGMKTALTMYGRKRINAITDTDLSRILAAEIAKGVMATSVRNRMRVLFTLLRWAKRRHYLHALPEFPELPEGAHTHFVPPTPEEAAAIYAHASERVRRAIVLGARLGVRVGPSELFKLRWEHVDLSKGVVRVQAAAKNKSEPWREVPIKSSLIPLFEEWMEQDGGTGYIINLNGKPISSIKTAWRNACRAAGITRKIRPYDLRHAFATDAIAAGADIGTVAKLMGHTSPQMVLKHYQHVMTQQKQAAVEALPDIPLGDRVWVTKEKGVILQ